MRTIVGCLSLLVITACEPTSTDIDVPEGALQLAMQDVPQEVAQYLYSGIPDRRRLYIDNQAEWAELWADVAANIQPPPPVPQIDFANEAVVVAAMGMRGTGGYSITIEGVYEGEGKLFVAVRETSPGSNCIVTQATTAPVHAVRTARRSLPIQFVERKETKMC